MDKWKLWCAFPELARRQAERMVLELRDKLDSLAIGQPARPARPVAAAFSAMEQDVLSALLNLGCARPAAEAALRKAKAAGAPDEFEPSVPARARRGAIISRECATKESFPPLCRTATLQFEASLRPQRLEEFTGQSKLKENLAIAIEAARQRGEAMDHVLLYGPPGLGKTTLAAIISNELEVSFEQTSGPILQKKLDLTGILSNIRPRQVFFIDEIHRLLPDVEECSTRRWKISASTSWSEAARAPGRIP